MVTLGLYVHLKAKAGKEEEVAGFLRSAQAIVADEPGTITWYAVREDTGDFSIFDTFEDDAGREAHLNGEVAKALMGRADELFSEPPAIHKIDVLAAKTSG